MNRRSMLGMIGAAAASALGAGALGNLVTKADDLRFKVAVRENRYIPPDYKYRIVKPEAPIFTNCTMQGDGSLLIEWKRRERVGDSIERLAESLERFNVEIIRAGN